MQSDWQEVSLSTAPLEIVDGDRGTNYPNQEEFSGHGYCLFLNAGNVTTDGFNFSDCMFINQEKDAKLRKGKLRRFDTVLTTRGTVGNVAYYDATVPFEHLRINSGMVMLRPDENHLSPQYLYFFVRSNYFKQQVKFLSTGSAQPQLPIRDINRIKIPLPPLAEQKAIARVLASLDDKIELNRRTNATLEALAQTLFRAWFVDFVPVRAKAAGFPPHPGPLPQQGEGVLAPQLPSPIVGEGPGVREISALFPSEFQESTLGLIPKGWEVGTLENIMDFALGGDWGKEDALSQNGEAAFCIRGADIPSLQSGGIGKMPLRYLKPASLVKRALQDRDLVIEISGGSPTQSTGRPVLITKNLLRRHIHPIVCSNFCRMVRFKNHAFAHYVYIWMRELYANDVFLQYENGTTGIKNFAFVVFSQQPNCILPPEKVLTEFDKLVKPIFDKMQSNGEQSQTLAALRDALLPRLISGRLRVPEAMREVES